VLDVILFHRVGFKNSILSIGYAQTNKYPLYIFWYTCILIDFSAIFILKVRLKVWLKQRCITRKKLFKFRRPTNGIHRSVVRKHRSIPHFLRCTYRIRVSYIKHGKDTLVLLFYAIISKVIGLGLSPTAQGPTPRTLCSSKKPNPNACQYKIKHF
jgi:hypothetical protein